MDEFETKRGRPKAAPTVRISHRISADLSARIDALAEKEFLTRNDAIHVALERGTNAKKED